MNENFSLNLSASNASNMSIYYQLPQYVGMGLSEMFTSVASYEFAYLAAPRAAQSLFMSLRFCSSGIASFIAIGYVQIFSTKNMDIDFSVSRNISFMIGLLTRIV